ncbi:MAG: flagellin FliC [Proteobacteria bacterium]|nr:flagellin FliC [Pseudomonadota bacterium]
MAMVINTNMGSANAVRLLDKTARSQSVTMERLTSGLRINSSKDDAAGMSVVTNMTTQIRGLDMAIRNANDGLSMVQTMDGAIEEVSNMLHRMRELGVQAMNGTYSSAQRKDMNVEYSQLTQEIRRIGSVTKFNGIGVFKPSVASMSFHVGWENGPTNKVGSGLLKLNIPLSQVAGSLAAKSLGTKGAASAAVGILDKLLSTVQTSRARWGAVMNRLDYTLNNLQTVKTNIEGSRSRIQDTDYAKESANLARTQVLQQAGMAMLTQSNQNGQNVLSLLK